MRYAYEEELGDYFIMTWRSDEFWTCPNCHELPEFAPKDAIPRKPKVRDYQKEFRLFPSHFDTDKWVAKFNEVFSENPEYDHLKLRDRMKPLVEFNDVNW